jgi:hypothetical protein
MQPTQRALDEYQKRQQPEMKPEYSSYSIKKQNRKPVEYLICEVLYCP